MVKTIIGDLAVQDYITDYKIDISPVYGENSFTDIYGEEIQDYLGDKITIDLSLGEVPHDIAVQLAEKLNAESVQVEYTTPAPAVSSFKKTSYSAVCFDADPDTADFDETGGIKWDISITLESITAASCGNRL